MAVYLNRSQAIAERLVKLRDYLYANASPTHAVKIGDILTYLANEGHEVEIKTVYSDLKTLEIHFGLDLHYDGRQRGYLLNNPLFAPYELREIVNSVQAAKFITQEEADRLTTKIMGLADRYTRPSLNRKIFIRNRVRNINEEAMKNLDIIYEAIVQDRKISYRYFKHRLNNQKPKEYCDVDSSKILTTSPYEVSWDGNQFIVFGVRAEPVTTSYWELEHMEQIKILEDKRDGEDIAKKCFGIEKEHTSREKTKLKVYNLYYSDVIDRFGNDVTISPLDDEFFIATIHESPSPELYMWTRTFFPCFEIVYPEGEETKLQNYFLELSKGYLTAPYTIYDLTHKTSTSSELELEEFEDLSE